MNTDKKIVIFDFDGVAADSAPFYCERYGIVAKMFNKHYPVKNIEDFKAWYDSAWENNYKNLGLNEEEKKIAVTKVRKKADYSDVPIFDGFKETLKKINSKYLTAFASCTDSHVIRKKLTDEGMINDICFISGGEGHGSYKEEIIRKVLEHFEMKPNQAVMVGDTEMDVISSAACNIRSIGTAYGWNTAERLIKAGASYIAYKPTDLPELIDKLFDDMYHDR